MENIIGRKQEIQELNNLYNSNKAQMVAIYGRRRVGKTFLVDEALKGRITFRHAGLSPNNEDSGKKNMLKDQLKHFYHRSLIVTLAILIFLSLCGAFLRNCAVLQVTLLFSYTLRPGLLGIRRDAYFVNIQP